MVAAVSERVARGALDTEFLVEILGEGDIETGRKVRIAEPQFVVHGGSERAAVVGYNIVAVQIDGLAVTAGGGQRQGAGVDPQLVSPGVAKEDAIGAGKVVIGAEI